MKKDLSTNETIKEYINQMNNNNHNNLMQEQEESKPNDKKEYEDPENKIDEIIEKINLNHPRNPYTHFVLEETEKYKKNNENSKININLIQKNHAGVQISLKKLFFAIKAFERNKYEDIEIEEMDNFDFIKVPRFDKIFFKKIYVILNNRKENSTIYVEKNKERETILSLNLKNSGGINKSKKKIHQFNVDTYIKVENICKETYNEIFLNKIDDILEK